MMKKAKARLALLIPIILILAFVLSACDSQDPRLATVYTYNPGAAFSTNINDDDPRRSVRVVVVFEVIDEAAVTELTAHNFIIRDSVLRVLGSLTMAEVTTNKDLDRISLSLVEGVNEALGGRVDLIIGAYFTEFSLS